MRKAAGHGVEHREAADARVEEADGTRIAHTESPTAVFAGRGVFVGPGVFVGRGVRVGVGEAATAGSPAA